MPVSGTTLIEQILASHPQVHGAGEREDFQAAVFAASGRRDFPALVADLTPAQLKAIGTDYIARVTASASPVRAFHRQAVGQFRLYRAYSPSAAQRAHRPLSARSDRQLSLVLFDYGLGELGRFYRGYARLIDHWREVLPAGVMLEMDYEDVVANLEGQARRLLAHCALESDIACLAFHKTERPVRTASAAQIRQPIYRGSVGRWRPYRDQLQPLFEALEIDLD